MSTEATEDKNARIYPCRDCGKMRSKAEGGTTFTVCDECWDKHFGPKLTPDLEADNERLRALVQVLVDRHGEVKWDAENCDWSCERCGNDYGMKATDLHDSTCQALAAAKEQGFTPTNTEDK